MIDERFSLKNIENASLCLNDNGLDQDSAISFLNEWCDQPNSIFSALELIQSSDDLTSRFIGSSLIKNKISLYWNQIDQNQKSQYRDSLASVIYSLTNIDDNISYNLIYSLCTIAIFDWPDEYPNFFEMFNDINESETAIAGIRILSSFLNEIDNTDLITDTYRNSLRQIVGTQYLEQITNIIENFISIPEFSNDILIICNCIIRWFLLEDFFDLELFNQIIKLLTNETTCAKAAQCLNSIFINKKIDEEILCTYSPILISSISQLILQEEIEFSDHTFLIFLIDFLKAYSTYYLKILIIDEIRENYPTQLDTLTRKLSTQLSENEIESETIKNDFVLFYRTIINIPPEEIVDELRISYQNLFYNVFTNIYNEYIDDWSTNEDILFFDTIYDELFLSIYNCQKDFDYDENNIENKINSTLSYMYLINPDYYIDFLIGQQPTPQLCWSIGSIQEKIDKSKHEMFKMILNILIKNLENDQSPEYISSLIYALSKCIYCLNSDNQLFDKFNQLIFESLSKQDNKLSICASSSFYDVVMNHVGLYRNDCLQYIELITNNCCEYLSNLDEKSSEKMIVSCTKLIRYFKHLTSQSKDKEMVTVDSNVLYQKLFEPFIEVLDNIDDFQPEIIEASLNIIGKVCIISKDTTTDLIDIIWPHLIQLASIAIPDSSISYQLIELILNAIAKIQVKFEYEKISPQIDDIFIMMTQRGKIEDCFFIYFAKLKKQFSEIKEIYEQIHQQFVLPFITQENTVSSEMFKMIEKFDFDVIDIEWLTAILIETIKNMSTDVVYAALDSFIFTFDKLTDGQSIILFFQNYADELIKTIIEAILDLLHKPLLIKFCEAIIAFLNKIDDSRHDGNISQSDYDQLKLIIKNSISEKLFEMAHEPQDGFFNDFIKYLFMNVSTSNLTSAFSQLLIMLRKASPCDFDIFKPEGAIDNFSEDDYDKHIESFIDDIDSNGNDLL